MTMSTVVVLLAAVSSFTTTASALSPGQQDFLYALAKCDTNYSVSSVIASYASASPYLMSNMTALPSANATQLPPLVLDNTAYVNMSATVPPITSMPAGATTLPPIPNLASLTGSGTPTPTPGMRH